MAYNIKGDVKTTGTLIIQNKEPGLNIQLSGNNTNYTPDNQGNINLPIKLQNEIDNIFSELPYSQYGAINNNEPGVAGTFDGGSTVAYYSAMPVLLENDGSLVYLRPGTNGSTINYYYTYINNPSASMRPYTTINKYYEGTWNNILFSDSDAKTCLLYEEVANNVLHLVLTNGTLNKNNHQTASIARNLIPHYIMTATVIGSDMYIVCLYCSNFDINQPTGPRYVGTDPFQFILYRIPVSEIQSGSVSTVEQISGITGTTLYGSQGSQNYIRISDVWGGTSGNVFLYGQPSFNELTGYTYSMPGMCKCIFDGTNLIFNMTTNCFARNNTERYDTMYSFRVFYNISTKSFTTDLTPSIPVVANGGSTGVITWNNPYSVTTQNLYGVGTDISDSLHGTWYITENGTQYYIREKYVLSDFYPVYSGKINNFVSKVNSYNIRNRTFTDSVFYNVYSDYASRVGDQLLGGMPISSTKIIFSGSGTYQGNIYTKYNKGVADIGSTRTYSYKSFMNGTISGYGPQAYRVPLTSEQDTHSGISYCDINGNVQFYGTVFIENNFLTAGNLLDSTTLSYDKTLSVDNSILTNLKNSIISTVGLSVTKSKIGLYYSPNTSYFNSVACVNTLNSSGGGNLIIASVDVTANSTSITGATLNTIINNSNHPTFTGIPDDSSEIIRHSGMSVVNYSDFTYVSITHLVNSLVPGDSQEFSYAGIKSGSNNLTSVIMNRSYHAPDLYTDGREYSYIPNYGFGYYMFTNSDKGTKLLFKYCGNTLSDYNNNLSAGTGTPTVILAQDVIQGFYLYFTEVTPVLMNGKFFEMPITTIDLSTIQSNPGNTKFYVYIDSSSGEPEYKVSITEIAESLTNMYIGFIQTDGTKVSDLNINKVSRIGIYRPSVTQIGSAFPVSTGNPAQTGTINW